MVSKVKLTFLGTADAIPSKARNHTAILLEYEGENILIDCGEGTQRQFRMLGLNPCKLTRILISHWHGDHVLGIPGLLQTLAFSGYSRTLYIYGPKGTKQFIQEMLKTFNFVNKIDLHVQEVDSGKFLNSKDFCIESERIFHGIPSVGYNFIIQKRVRIDKQKLKKYKIKPGPILAELKKGKDIIYNGKKCKAKDLVYESEGKKISFILDTAYDSKLSDFAKDADLLITECSFSTELEERAGEYHHLTSKQAGEIAKKAKAGKLILTHISQRYEANPGKILKEAKKVFPKTEVAKDLMEIEV